MRPLGGFDEKMNMTCGVWHGISCGCDETAQMLRKCVPDSASALGLIYFQRQHVGLGTLKKNDNTLGWAL